ncbi:hypothetical protein RIF29_24052 [Crotalaria pallida]|uniref:Uncharacterized protein n=1 Tax=Crotalaria pallida TaxID=3830 RepID=A0AAN9HW72_CROPI
MALPRGRLQQLSIVITKVVCNKGVKARSHHLKRRLVGVLVGRRGMIRWNQKGKLHSWWSKQRLGRGDQSSRRRDAVGLKEWLHAKGSSGDDLWLSKALVL